MAGPPPPPRVRAPINKFDHEAVETLEALPLSEWEHLIPDLLHWMEDIHWPVFATCRDLLAKHPDAVAGPLREVWDSWGMVDSQVWIFGAFVPLLPMRTQARLKEAIERWKESEWWPEARDEWEVEESVDEWLREVEEWEGKEGRNA